MDFSSISSFLAPVVIFAAGAFKLFGYINGYKDKLELAERALQAVKAGADGTLSLLGEVVAASADNSLSLDEFNQIVKTASDIPVAIKIALKKSAVTNPTPSA